MALATDDQLAGLRAAVSPIYERLRADPATAETMAAVEALKADVGPPPPPAIPEGCLFQPSDLDVPVPLAATGPGETGDLPQGTYRYELSTDAVVQAGDAGSILQEPLAGVFTWQLRDGEWTVTATPSSADVPPVICHGWYSVEGPLVSFTYDPLGSGEVQHCLPPVWSARWAPSESGVRWGPPSVAALLPYIAGTDWERIE